MVLRSRRFEKGASFVKRPLIVIETLHRVEVVVDWAGMRGIFSLQFFFETLIVSKFTSQLSGVYDLIPVEVVAGTFADSA